MDDLLREFLTETNESLDVVDNQLVRFEQEPNNAKILDNIFRLVHTIKGTCGFLGLPRLEALAHAAETLMGKFRDGMPVTGQAVTLILTTIDRIKEILNQLEATEAEPEGADEDLIEQLHHLAEHGADAVIQAEPAPPPVVEPEPQVATGSLTFQVLERPLRPGEVSLDDLERAFRETEVEMAAPPIAPAMPAEPVAEKVAAKPAAKPAVRKSVVEQDAPASESDKISNQSIRVNVDTLEHLMTMVSELVLTRNQLLEISRRNEDNEFKVPLQRLSSVTAELQEGVMKTRMQPIGNAWQKLPRIVRDLSSELGKQIELEMHGADTELDRQVLDLIKDPLTHMVRNSADHGLETPAERARTGKPEQGTIRLSAYHEGGHIIICIADNGRGLDTDRIKAKALANGLVTEAELEKMSEAQIHKFIFAPGFSTAAAVTSVSGRGVGMDVVRTNIDQIGGTIDIKSVPGEGASVTIKIPLTLAIVSALIVEAAGDRFAIPQLAVVELVRARANSEHRIERIKDTPVLRLRNKLLPLTHLKKLLKIDEGEATDPENGFIVVTQIGGQTFGIVVDGVFHTEEIVVKPMSSMLRHINMFSGNTILGDGAVIMIVDPNGIATALGTAIDAQHQIAEENAASRHQSDQTTSLLVFRAGSSQPKAVPLALVTRLEELSTDKIELSNGRYMVQYREQLMPLVQVEGVEIRTTGVQPILVFSDDGRSMGLVVDEIIDIVEERLNIEVASGRDGVLGSAVIKGQATEVIDVGHFLPMAFSDWFTRKEMRVSAASQSVLLVDDSAFFRNMLAPVLKAAGYRVTVATNAQEGLGVLRAGQKFDVVLTDIEMPDMNGFEFAETIRSDRKLGTTPIIALSSVISPAAIERGRQAGFHDYVAKFDRPGLIAALKEQTTEIHQAA
ncbi:hybrid sensor histidine kinase/response regulator [Bradyrhizobium sp. U87765 SZCCT0131]|uniref:hybrid sensor histidine kinase/response regulator n=1 Tax=unclassified Bradyrhizobium TaxID=2631580 RepID=UPI001BA8A16B|nr:MULTISPECIES: hybrid sensor histidine kinase/response regulator [unclassified Bradyrhizobium]MBR1222470.1 hybrid sensor histidine kinase/response regulator [Bradyrhizobium sp. U87765 SZCCT0131]MBR1264046.1 hybrid sensor histidine kinase/response regulator [Bradyrhizobium sp. U87765 SZCCT0134]MBR1308171.1 hybrid sensor histidine kinase/response regulator [Bradyrhizobium sp. U87765 SZCCT0110]MBR1320296.1 hybrid sensor histidine kinase/response regulator [Bradyrhizobium sp. U87765 SZCCT0109]MB